MFRIREKSRFYSIRDLDGVEAIEATFTRHRFRPHYHDTFLIGVTESGAESFWSRGARHVSTTLSLRLHNPGEVHAGGAAAGLHWSYRCLYPPASLLHEIAREAVNADRPDVWFPDLIQAGSPAALHLLQAFESLRSAASSLERGTRFRVALGEVIRLHNGHRPSPKPSRRDPRTIARAQAYIADHIARDVTLDDLSRVVGLSPFHLLRTFKQQVGLTPFTYQTQQRVRFAKALLARGVSVSETARHAGFYDRSHMSRCFLAFMGITPAAFRASLT